MTVVTEMSSTPSIPAGRGHDTEAVLTTPTVTTVASGGKATQETAMKVVGYGMII